MRLERIGKSHEGFSLRFADDQKHNRFTRTVFTIPLKSLVSFLPWSDLSPYTAALRHNSTLFVLVGLKQGASFDNFG